MILVDTSVIVDVFTEDPQWVTWSRSQIRRYTDHGVIGYNSIIFAELAVKFGTKQELEQRLSEFEHLPLSLDVAFQAGKGFEKYRKASGKKSLPLPDFFIGAYACVDRLPLLTRDPRRVRSYFPSVQLIVPRKRAAINAGSA